MVLDIKKNLETNQTRIRPISKMDYLPMLEWTQVKDMWTYFTVDLSKPDILKKWIDDALKDPNRIAFSIIHQPTNQLIGSTSIGNISMHDKRAEIGWTWIAQPFQGTGLNAEVKGALLHYLFETCTMERVECKTDVLNLPARKSLQKIGMTEEGVLRSHTLMTNNRRRDTIYYSILKSEWPKLKKLIGGN